MTKSKKIQYTIRGVSETADHLLREKAETYGISLNDAVLETLKIGLGQTGHPLHQDFEVYANTWVEDVITNQALEAQRRIDPDLWT